MVRHSASFTGGVFVFLVLRIAGAARISATTVLRGDPAGLNDDVLDQGSSGDATGNVLTHMEHSSKEDEKLVKSDDADSQNPTVGLSDGGEALSDTHSSSETGLSLLQTKLRESASAVYERLSSVYTPIGHGEGEGGRLRFFKTAGIVGIITVIVVCFFCFLWGAVAARPKKKGPSSSGSKRHQYMSSKGKVIYEWSQTSTTISIFMTPPPGLTKEKLDVVVNRSHIAIGRKRADPFLSEDLFSRVDEGSTDWSFEDGELVIVLHKQEREEWPGVIKSHVKKARSTSAMGSSPRGSHDSGRPNTSFNSPRNSHEPSSFRSRSEQ